MKVGCRGARGRRDVNEAVTIATDNPALLGPSRRARFDLGGTMFRILFFSALFAASWLTTEALGDDWHDVTDHQPAMTLTQPN